MKSQMKQADRSGAAFAVIVGTNELDGRHRRAATIARQPTASRPSPVTDLLDHLTKALR